MVFFQGNCTPVKNTEFLFCDLQIFTTYCAHAQLFAFSFQPSFIIIMVKCFSLRCDFQRRFNALSFWYGLKRQVCDSKNSTLSNRKNNIFPFGGTDSSSMYLTSQVIRAWYFMLIAASGHYRSILFHHLFKSKIYSKHFISAVENDYSWLYFNLRMIHMFAEVLKYNNYIFAWNHKCIPKNYTSNHFIQTVLHRIERKRLFVNFFPFESK